VAFPVQRSQIVNAKFEASRVTALEIKRAAGYYQAWTLSSGDVAVVQVSALCPPTCSQIMLQSVVFDSVVHE